MAKFQVRAVPTININDKDYPLHMSEADMLDRSEAIKGMADEISKPENQTTANLLRVCRAVEAYINDLCGDGAMAAMAGGVAMSVIDTVHLLGVVNEEATKAFSAALVAKHE